MPLLHDMLLGAPSSTGNLNSEKYIAAVRGTTTFTLLNRNGSTLSLATTYTLSHAGGSVAFNPTGDYIAVIPPGASGNLPVTVLSHSSGTVALASTYTLAAGGTGSVYPHSSTWSSTGSQLVFTTTLTCHALNFSAGTLTLGSVYNIGRSSIQGISKHPLNNTYFVTCVNGTAPHVVLLSHSSGTLSLSATYTLSGGCSDVDFSPNGDYVACAHALGNRFTLLSHSAGSLSYAATYVLQASGTPLAARYNPAGSYIAIGRAVAPSIVILNQSGASVTFASSYTTGSGGLLSQYSFLWTKAGDYLFAGNANGNIIVYNHSVGTITYASSYTVSGSGVILDMSLHP